MEGELFLEGQPPDFSILQELLCPPCLESEPSCNPVSASGDFGSETAAAREFGFEPFSNMACCLQMPDSKALSFLQESTQLLSQAEPIGMPFAPTDALNLISLHCSSLESEPLDQVKPPEAGEIAHERSPITHSKDHSSHLLGRACVEEPRLTQLSESQRGRRRVFRKQPKPRRSYEALDPNFQGVTLHMKLCLCQSSSEGCRLIINPQFSSGKLRKRSGVPLAEECKTGSLEEEGFVPAHRNKRCASCKTRKTPLWRDAEDGTPLCNACGIRYKKYRIRCFHCWSIPKHGGKPYPHCSNCGGKLGVVAAQQKPGRRYSKLVN
ncbi:GATA-type zinc finger protein 1 [Protobothrops mucrosquamatus]|uniref:GATA-type zinc finger protein 1 n=1 Tax=Protobothrops mucrosquamatus TaxID=103944 RepID=UPI0010FB5B47|nr:GATA-type zinc finger protein 1 [Protobothrops mucrosquamatus]